MAAFSSAVVEVRSRLGSRDSARLASLRFQGEDGGAGGGDQDFVDLYKRHHPAVYQFVRKMCGEALADDVTQEVFVHWWRGADGFDPARGSIRGYLMASAYHRAIDLLRAEKARRAREEKFGDDPQASGNDTMDQLVSTEAAATIAAAVARLCPAEREAVAVAFFGCRTYRETASRLGAPEGTVKARIRSGLAHLQIPLSELRPSVDMI